MRENNFTYQLCIRIKYTPPSPNPCTASTSVHGLPVCVCVCASSCVCVRESVPYIYGTDKAYSIIYETKKSKHEANVCLIRSMLELLHRPPSSRLILPGPAACSKLKCRNDVLVICLNCKWHGLLIEKLNHLLGPQIVIRRFGYDFRLWSCRHPRQPALLGATQLSAN